MERGEVIGGRYWVKHCLHRTGGYAVYAAVDLRESTSVRLRTYSNVSPSGVEYFEHVAARLSEIQTTRVEKLRAFGATSEGDLYAASLLPSGAPLDHLLAAGLNPHRRSLVARRAIEALAGLHALDLTHGALSTKSLYVADDDAATVSLADLALVPPGQIDPDASSPSLSQELSGSLAPELLRAQPAPFGASDVFALGAALFEMLTGVAPFRAETLLATYLRVLYEEPYYTRSAANFASDLATIRRMLDKSPSTRPSPRELLTSLGASKPANSIGGAVTLRSSSPLLGIILFELRLPSSVDVKSSVDELQRRGGVRLLRVDDSTLVTEIVAAPNVHPVLAAARVACRLRAVVSDAVFAISVGGEGSLEAAASLLRKAPLGTIALTQDHVRFVARDFDVRPYSGALTLWERGQPVLLTAADAEALDSRPTQEFQVDPALFDAPISARITLLTPSEPQATEGPAEGSEPLPKRADTQDGIPAPSKPVQVDHLQSQAEIFLGRKEEIGALGRAIEQGSKVLLLTGSPGIGKSALARQSALEVGARLGFAPVFCPLEEVSLEADFLDAMAQLLRFPPGDFSYLELILTSSRLLIVLDDVDRITDVCLRFVKQWSTVGESRWIVTSREQLVIPASFALELGPLPEAEELFVLRAQEFSPQLGSDEAFAQDVRALVDELDRIPLAVKLAANQIAWLSPRDLRERMRDVLSLLEEKDARKSKKQATAAGALQLSWDLCSAEEQRALAALSVFPSEFSLAAAEEVLRHTAKEENSAFTHKKAVDVLASLRRRSLLSSSWKDGRTRFRLLLIVRAWAEGFRASWGLLAPALRGWVGHLTSLAKPLLDAPRPSGETRFLNAEREDFAAILRGRLFPEGPWTASPEDRLVALCALDDWPYGDGLHNKEVAAVASALEQAASVEIGLLARGRRVHALQLAHLGKWADAVRLIDETLPQLSDPRFRGLAGELILIKAVSSFGWGDHANAFEMSRQAEGILLEVGWYAAAGFARLRIGDVLQSLHRGEEARMIFERAIAFAGAHEIPFVKARANAALGFYWLERGDHERSHQAYGQAISFMSQESTRRYQSILKVYDALVWLDAEDYQQGLSALSELGPQRAQELSPPTFRLAAALRALTLASLDQLELASVQRVLAEPRGQLPPWLQHVIRIHLAHVELARARWDERSGNPESAQLTHHATKLMLEEYARDGELVRTSDDARVALRMLKRALAKQAPSLG